MRVAIFDWPGAQTGQQCLDIVDRTLGALSSHKQTKDWSEGQNPIQKDTIMLATGLWYHWPLELLEFI